MVEVVKIHNKLKDGVERKLFHLNEIIEYKDFAEIILYRKNIEFTRIKIDTEDIKKIKDYKWNLDSRQYGKNSKYQLLMHRVIMDAKKGDYVDHVSHDTLDNRKSNLRIVTNQQNGMNRKLGVTNTSGRTGVFWNKNTCKWMAAIGVNKKLKHLGTFSTYDEAVQARLSAELKHFGEYRFKS